MKKRVSVCIATHNGEKYIKEQVSSILSQLNKDDEIIISDDGSSDNTLNIIRSYNDARIKIIEYKHPRKYTGKFSSFFYASANFMNALKYASGEYIFLSDQDDVWYPEKVQKCVSTLQNNDIVSHNFSIINDSSHLIQYRFLEDYDVTPWKIRTLIKTPYRGCCVAFNRKLLNKVIPYPRSLFLHDFWIGYNSAIYGFSYRYIDEPLIKYRRHHENVSELIAKNSLAFKIFYRVKLIYQVLYYILIRKLRKSKG